MGYTNYWIQKKAFSNDEWTAIKKEYDYMVENFNDVLIEDQTKKKSEIVFNGLKENDLNHETFYLTKKIRPAFYEGDNRKFNFCKTARKPYDLAVWHLLTFIRSIAPDKIKINRDNWTYWGDSNEI